MLIQLLLLTLVGSTLSLLGAGVLSFKQDWDKDFSLHLTAFSSGILLVTALLHLAPEALHLAPSNTVFTSIFFAIVSFFLLERLMLWYHHHHDPHHNAKPHAALIIIGDTLHNFVDGVLIAGSFLLNPSIGVFTTIAVAAHEIPQEIAEFSILVSAGFSKKKAFLFNILSSLSSILAAVLTYLSFTYIESFIPQMVAFSAGMFLYIALSDLIPELHQSKSHSKQKWIQVIFFFLGIGTYFLVSTVIPDLHTYNDEEHIHADLEHQGENDHFHEEHVHFDYEETKYFTEIHHEEHDHE